MVFDDTFSTGFSDGKFTDDVWNSLVLSNHDRHPNTDFAIDMIPFQDDETSFERETESETNSEIETKTNSSIDEPPLPVEPTT